MNHNGQDDVEDGAIGDNADDEEKKNDDRRLRWRSRRGMLEVELALVPFVERRLESLSAADRALYARLLEHDDVDIYDWVQGRAEPADPELAGILAAIRDAARA